jgi:hypothetical protein
MTANEEHDKLKAQKENADLPTWFDENTSVMPSDFKIGSDFKRSLNSIEFGGWALVVLPFSR